MFVAGRLELGIPGVALEVLCGSGFFVVRCLVFKCHLWSLL